MMIQDYMSVLHFYRNIEKDITKREIEVIKQIQEKLKLDDDFECKNFRIDISIFTSHVECCSVLYLKDSIQ